MQTIRQLQKDIQKAEINAQEARRLADVEQASSQQRPDGSPQESFLASDAQRQYRKSDELNDQIEKLQQELAAQEARVSELQSQRAKMIEQHTADIAALDKEITNLLG